MIARIIGIIIGIIVFLGALFVPAIWMSMDGKLKPGTIEETTAVIIIGDKLVDNQVGNRLKDRLDTAIPILKGNKKIKVVVSGGITNNAKITEAEAMKRYLSQKGISSGRIFVESDSTTLVEKIVNSAYVLEKHDIIRGKKLIVTTDHEVFRVRIIKAITGFDAVTLGVKGNEEDKVMNALFEYPRCLKSLWEVMLN